MAAGSVTFRITDLRQRPVQGRVRIACDPHESGQGGSRVHARFEVDGHDTFSVSDIPCHAGLGTLYTVRVQAPGYKPYAFFQRIEATPRNLPSEPHVRLMVNPRKVKDILPPRFADLPAAFRRGLEQAGMVALASEDADLVGAQGAALYEALGPLRKACLLNLVAKATHPSTERLARFVRAPTVLRQDRCFAEVDPALHALLCRSDRFVSAPSLLHAPPPGFTRLDSFKSRDPHANIQVTFMRAATGEAMWADIDIDEADGLRHGFEVIRNAVIDGRTNPYLIRELLLKADDETPIDPKYDFTL